MTDMNLTLVFILAGIIGAGLRAFLAASQEAVSRKSVVDVIVGGLVGGLYPLYPVIPLVGNWLQQGLEVALLSYVAGDVVQNAILARVPKAQAFLSPRP